MSDIKQFSLKPIELRLLQVEQELYNTKISNLCTFIATERLAYHVTENTQFSLEGDTLIVAEVEPQEDKPAETPEPEIVGDNGSIADAAEAK